MIGRPKPFFSQSSQAHSPQPKIDFSYYKYVSRLICLLICGVLLSNDIYFFQQAFVINSDDILSKYLKIANSQLICTKYRKIASSNTSRLEAHAGFFIAYEGDFWSLCMWPFDKKFIS